MNKIIYFTICISFLLYFSCDSHSNYLKTHYPNGNVKTEYSVKDSIKHGPFTIYYENGIKKLEGFYYNGEVHGILKRYHENGNLKTLSNWSNGINWGIVVAFYPNNELHGYFLLNPKGEIMWRREYNQNGSLKLDEGSGLLTIMPSSNYRINDTIFIDLYFVYPPDCKISLKMEKDNTITDIDFKYGVKNYGECYYQYKELVQDTGRHTVNFVLTQNYNGIANEFQSQARFYVSE